MRKVKLFSVALVIVFFFSNVSIIPGNRHFIQFGAEEVYGESVDSYTKLLLHFEGSNGSNTFTDECGHTITAGSGPQISTDQKAVGNSSGCFSGNGISTLSITNSNDFNLSNQDFTIDTWIMPTSYSSDFSFIFSLSGRSQISNASLGVFLTSTGKLRWSVSSGTGLGTNLFINTSTATLSLNTWYHIALVRNGSNFKGYINGIEDPSLSFSSTGILKDSVENFTIGFQNNCLPDYYFKGYIDEFRLSKGIARWTSNFTPSGIPKVSRLWVDSYTKMLMHFDGSSGSTNFIDECYHWVMPNGNVQISSSNSKFGGSSVYFDGNGDYLEIPSSSDFDILGGDFTIDFWFKAMDLSGKIMAFAVKDGTFYLNLENNKIIAWAPPCRITSNFTLTDYSWHHFALVRSGAEQKLFIDGFLDSSITTDNPPYFSQFYNVYVGRYATNTERDFKGYIDEFRISKGVARWTSNFTPPDIPYINREPISTILSPSQNGTLFLTPKTTKRSV
jgi:hypothetical protein